MGAYQYKREPLTVDEANQLANACSTQIEQLIVWTFLDTGMRGLPSSPLSSARRSTGRPTG